MLRQFHEDRELRNAARAVLKADLDHARATLSAKSFAARVAGRVGDGAKDVFEAARTTADDNRGVLAGLIGALMLWFARSPIMEVLGLSTDDGEAEAERDAHAGKPGATDHDIPQGEYND
jgi:hypothetical protein